MALDSRQKRFSMMGLGRVPAPVLFEADSSVDADDRLHLLGLYSGIAAAAATILAEVTVIEGASLSGLTYAVFDGYDISTASIVKTGTDETTDASGLLSIDVTGLVADSVGISIVITDYTDSPTAASNCAVCYCTTAAQ